MKSLLSLVLCLALMLFLSGCASLGAKAMKGERINLNVAIQQTNDEQLLLNLVRLRYRETPSFLEVSSISSQSRFEAGLEAGVDLERSGGNTDLFKFLGASGYSNQPTLTYTPLQGDSFIQRILTPLSLEKIKLLYNSGWSIRRVFLLCIQRLNNIKNAIRASGPTPGRVPEYKEFLRVVDILQELEKRELVEISYALPASGATPPGLVLQIDPNASDLPEVREFRGILNLDPAKTVYPLVYANVRRITAEPREYIDLDTRSLLGIMFYLSHSVAVPDADVKMGKVTVTRTDTGNPFDWGSLIGDLFKLRSDSQKPPETCPSVRYRGNWFFISDSDLESKSTFSMLAQIFSLQAGKAEGIGPVLTLPVGR